MNVLYIGCIHPTLCPYYKVSQHLLFISFSVNFGDTVQLTQTFSDTVINRPAYSGTACAPWGKKLCCRAPTDPHCGSFFISPSTQKPTSALDLKCEKE